MELNKNAIDMLKARGHRLTRQRQTVLDILLKSREHLDAEKLYDLARKQDRNISLATVYRSLTLLKEAGLVQEHRLGDSHGHFETTPDAPHYHFTCMNCGHVIEFSAPQVMETVRDLCQLHAVEITQVHLHLSGYCAACRRSDNGCEKL